MASFAGAARPDGGRRTPARSSINTVIKLPDISLRLWCTSIPPHRLCVADLADDRVDESGEDDDRAEDHLLHEWRDPSQVQGIRQRLDEERAEEHRDGRTHSAGQ